MRGAPALFVSTHSRSKAAAGANDAPPKHPDVSTHSRSKAAAYLSSLRPIKYVCFNSQPLEGGCLGQFDLFMSKLGFNSQPLEGGCRDVRCLRRCWRVSTHSRPKAAAKYKETGKYPSHVSTHSRPKAAASVHQPGNCKARFQLTAARRRLLTLRLSGAGRRMFQLTAARRRLRAVSSICRRIPYRFQLTATRRRLRFSFSSRGNAA